MELLFLCLGVGLLASVALIFYALVVGVRALLASRRASGERAASMRHIGLNLCEPAVGFPLVWVALNANETAVWAVCAGAVALLLLAPARGWSFRDGAARAASRGALGRGAARWAFNVAIFGVLWGTSSGAGEWTPLLMGLPGFGVGCWLLWHCTRWGQEQVMVALAPPAPPAAPPPPGPSYPAAPYGPAATNAYVAQAPAVLHAPAAPRGAPCPACGAPARERAAVCPACGLAFAARTPEELRAHPRYLPLRPLGQGGMSSVFLARDRLAGRLCVVKTVASVERRDLGWRAEAAACLRREGDVLARLLVPGVVRLYERADLAGEPLLALEYLAGPSAERRLTCAAPGGEVLPGAPVPPPEALGLGRAVAETLCALAALPRPLAHCDVKPANLVLRAGAGDTAWDLSGAAPVVLVDFGGAVELGADPPERYGTPGYAAPEQYRGGATLRSDVYGLAATLYHLLTDDDPTAHPLRFPGLGSLPSGVAAALAGALEHDYERRPDARTFADALRAVAG